MNWLLAVLAACFCMHTCSVRAADDGPRFTPNNYTFLLEGTDWDDPIAECQVCMSFWQPNVDPMEDGIFRFAYAKLNELDKDGDECCEPPYNCNYGPDNGCDGHNIDLLPPIFTETWSTTKTANDTVTFTGRISSNFYYSGDCTPPGNNVALCADATFTFQIVYNEYDVNVGPSNFTLRPNSMRMKIQISNWPFAAGSTGLRVMMFLATRRVSATDFLIQPGDISAFDAPYDGAGFDAATIVNFYTRRGQVSFPKYAIVDGAPYAVNVTGPYNLYSLDRQGRHFYVDVPVCTTFEYETNIYVPPESGNPDPFVNKKRRAASIVIISVIAASSACGFCLLVGGACKVYHRFCRGHKKHNKYEMS